MSKIVNVVFTIKQLQIVNNIFENRLVAHRSIRIKELQDKLGKQYKERMAKLSVIKKKKLDELRLKLWRTFLSDRDRRKEIILPKIRKYFKEQEKRIDQSLVKKEYKKKSYFKKYIKKVLDDFDWQKENEKLFAVIEPYSLTIARISGKTALRRLGLTQAFITEGNISVWLKNFAKVDASLINDTTRKKLAKQLFEGIEAGEGIGEIKDRVKDVYKIRSNKEAIRIARTQTGRVINQATVEAYNQTEVVDRKEWIATLDDRVRPEHKAADGQIVDKGKPFLVGGDLKDAPNDVNCRCTVAPVLAGDN